MDSMRAQAVVGKWCAQWGQTFRFSSSSLSNIISSQLGHLVQSPCGISRLRVAPGVTGFFSIAFSTSAGGGVTAGSAVSRPKVFFGVSAIYVSKFRWKDVDVLKVFVTSLN